MIAANSVLHLSGVAGVMQHCWLMVCCDMTAARVSRQTWRRSRPSLGRCRTRPSCAARWWSCTLPRCGCGPRSTWTRACSRDDRGRGPLSARAPQHVMLSHGLHPGIAKTCVQVKVVSVKTDLRYWPCWRLALDAASGEWRREVLSTAAANSSAGQASAAVASG